MQVLYNAGNVGGNRVFGNSIGPDAAGVIALGNGSSAGLQVLDHESQDLIGGTVTGAGNVISGNAAGVTLSGLGDTGNFVEGNDIGVVADGLNTLPNGTGVVIDSGASGDQIGAPVGAGALAAATNVTALSTPGALFTAGSINGDGAPDVLFSSRGATPIQELIDRPNGSFFAPVAVAGSDGETLLGVGDFRGDGIQDLIVVDGGELGIRFGNGDGTFAAPVLTQPADYPDRRHNSRPQPRRQARLDRRRRQQSKPGRDPHRQ